ncbi:hypothetical protein ACSBR2_000998 [Camellia fascicularis]
MEIRQFLFARGNMAADAVFSAEPWTVPWTAKTILQRVKKWNVQQNHLQTYQTLSPNLPKSADLDPWCLLH